jgi:hypothetical protein
MRPAVLIFQRQSDPFACYHAPRTGAVRIRGHNRLDLQITLHRVNATAAGQRQRENRKYEQRSEKTAHFDLPGDILA